MRVVALLFGVVGCSAPDYGFADATSDGAQSDAGPDVGQESSTFGPWCAAQTSNTLCSSDGGASFSYTVDGNCYVWFCGLVQKIGWHSARDRCAALDGGSDRQLVVFETDQELSDVWTQIGTAGGSRLWIGLSSSALPTFVWVSGAPLTVNHWIDGGPAATGSCVYLDMALGQWTNAPCGDDNDGGTLDSTAFHNFICEVAP
jgi:hypothetical protein